MKQEIIDGQNKKNHIRVRMQLNKDSNQTNSKRDQFLAHLKSRYGYNDDKAEDELDRLVKQFNRQDRSSGIPRTRLKYKHPHVE